MRLLTMATVGAFALAAWACRPAEPPTPASSPTPAPAATSAPAATPASQPTPVPATTEKENTMTPQTTSSAALHPQILFQTTAGDFTLELDGEKAPISTLNFVQYVKDGYYKGTIFHRTISNFMIQGGGMNGDFSPKGEGLRPPIKNEWRNGLKNLRGTISMARTNNPDSATSQFFINTADNESLDVPSPLTGNAAYAVLGKVISGMDTIDKIRNGQVTRQDYGPEMSKPVNPVVVNDAKLVSEFDQAAVEKLAQR